MLESSRHLQGNSYWNFSDLKLARLTLHPIDSQCDPGAIYLVRDAAGVDRTSSILLDGDTGDHAQGLRQWLVASSKKARSQALMSYLRKNESVVVHSEVCESDPRTLVPGALLALH